ncbi:MAG: isopentenyl transferase family protein, partial [Chloroflexota bacterium]
MTEPCHPSLSPVIAIVGPTAVGKSALAMELAARLDAAIVTADSRQVYRYLDIGTAKPGARDRARIDHYML